MIRVGAVGHRKLLNSDHVTAVRDILATVFGFTEDDMASSTAMQGIIISALAEGADRLIAREGLSFPGVALHALLPLPIDDYRVTFTAEDSDHEFDALLLRSARVEVIPATESRSAAFVNAGRALVDRSDVVIAIWDGEPARGAGGTADVVDYARQRGRPLYWIHSKDAKQVVTERLSL